jgi:hypothetical protein
MVILLVKDVFPGKREHKPAAGIAAGLEPPPIYSCIAVEAYGELPLVLSNGILTDYHARIQGENPTRA